MNKIEWKDGQEPALSARNLNAMQDNLEEALKNSSGVMTNGIIGYEGDDVPEGFEEIDGFEIYSEGKVNFEIAVTSVEGNNWYKFGKIAHIYLLFSCSNQIPTSATTVIARNLPKAVRNMQLSCINGNTNANIRLHLTSEGMLQFWYNPSSIPANQVICVNFTYISKE